MEIEYLEYLGSIHIGVAILCTENFSFVPNNSTHQMKSLVENITKTNVIELSEYIIGSLMVGNSHGFVVSNVITQEVLKKIQTTNLTVYQAPEFFAFGNVVLTNDFGGIISPIIPPKIRKQISETLNIPLETRTLAKSDLVGSLAYVTNYGGLITPLAEEEEVAEIKDILHLKEIGVGSINRGSEFVASGIVGNTKGILVGRETTGIEIMEITRCFIKPEGGEVGA
ncbi:translation initiation factor IF-6 [Candidatus Hodarchaeum mangrovi]